MEDDQKNPEISANNHENMVGNDLAAVLSGSDLDLTTFASINIKNLEGSSYEGASYGAQNIVNSFARDTNKDQGIV